MAEVDDELSELIIMAQSGDESAIRKIVEKTQSRLFKFLFYLTNNTSSRSEEHTS